MEGAVAAADAVEQSEDDARNNSEVAAKAAGSFRYSSGLNSAQVVPRYAPGTLLQAGPGLPDWSYVDYSFDWSGPVDPEQTVRFLYIGPVALGDLALRGHPAARRAVRGAAAGGAGNAVARSLAPAPRGIAAAAGAGSRLFAALAPRAAGRSRRTGQRRAERAEGAPDAPAAVHAGVRRHHVRQRLGAVATGWTCRST